MEYCAGKVAAYVAIFASLTVVVVAQACVQSGAKDYGANGQRIAKTLAAGNFGSVGDITAWVMSRAKV